MTPDERDRLMKLETRFDHLQAQMEDTHAKVTIMHDLLMQAKGARWFIVGMAAIAGFAASFMAKWFAFFGSMPK
jgi:lipid-A-disaccharide synthase-like uncharacterized protein